MRIYDASRKLVRQLPSKEFYVTGNHDETVHPENLLVHIPLPARGAGGFIEILTTEEALHPSTKFPYLRFTDSDPYPAIENSLELLRPPSDLAVHRFGATRIDTLPDRLTLSIEPGTHAPPGPFTPIIELFGSGFSVCTKSTWEQVGNEYQEFLRSRGADSDSIPFSVREKASELVEARRGQDPVRTLFRFVRDEIRYNNFEFSLHALVPEPTDKVLLKGDSDCKGLSLLLVHLLRARGIKANLALVSLEHSGYIDQPTLHQFNHMIVHVTGPNGDMFLDPTEKFQPFRQSPLALEGKLALVLESRSGRVSSIPEIHVPVEHGVRVHHTLVLNDSGMAMGLDSLILTGKAASEFRSRMHGWNSLNKAQTLVSWITDGYSQFQEEQFRIHNETDPDEPLIFSLRFRRKFPLQSQSQELVHLPRLERSFLRYPRAENRYAPVFIPHDFTVLSEWKYIAPANHLWNAIPIEREISQSGLRWKLMVDRNEPGELVLRQTWKLTAFMAPAEEYRKILRDWDSILAESGLRVGLVRR